MSRNPRVAAAFTPTRSISTIVAAHNFAIGRPGLACLPGLHRAALCMCFTGAVKLAAPNLATSRSLPPPPFLHRLSAAVQTAFMVYCFHLTPVICASASMAAAPARQLMHRLARLLAPASALSLHPLYVAPPAGDGAAECCAVLRFSQLTLGLLLPLALQAQAEAALFQRHQRQRRAAGLPPEHGFAANLLTLIHGMLHPAVRPHLCVCCLLALGLCWVAAVGSLAGPSSA